MQNPEVWSFNEPQSTFKIHELNIADLSSKQFEHFYFNHLISVVLPDSLRVPEGLSSLLSDDCEYYKVLDINLSDLIDPTFTNNFIKKGKLALLSIGTRIDCDNCCAITPSGNLILSLTKDTYQSFGIEGKTSHYTQRNKDRYIVKIDLKSAKLVPGKAYYERTKAALNSLEPFTVIVKWTPPEQSVCPSSLAKYFDGMKYIVRACEPSVKSHVVYSVKTPTLDEEKVDESNIIDFIEWLGMISVDGDLTGDAANYVNTYEPPEPNIELGQIRVLTWRGFYHPSEVMRLIDYLKEYNCAQDKMWISVYVQGFSDALVIEREEEQNYFTNGDNANIFIMKRSRCWFCKHRCSLKKYK